MLATFLIQVAVNTSIVLAAAWAVTAAMGRCSAAARHLVWSTALLGTLVVPVVAMFGPAWSLPVLPTASPRARVEAPTVAHPSGSRATSQIGKGAIRAEQRGPIPTDTLMRQAWRQWVPLAAMLWLVGAAIGLARLSVALLGAARLARGGRSLTDPGWMAPAERAAATLEMTAPLAAPALRLSDQTTVPLACGLWRAVLLMPADAEGWSADRRRVVLLHELAHVKRRDCLVRAAAQAACALEWFNPLAWLAVRRLRIEQERACDDLVLTADTAAPDYAEHLFDIARASRATALDWATLAMARPSQLEGRMLSILDPHRRRHAPSRPVRVVVTSAVGLAVLLVGALQLSAMNQASPRQLDSTTGALTRRLPDPPQVAAALGMRPAELAAVLRNMRDQVKGPGHDMAIREWTRLVDRETRQRIAGALAPGLNDADDSVRQTATEALAALPHSDGPVLVTTPCRGNCVGSHDDMWESLMIMWLSSDLQSPDLEIRTRAVQRLPLRSASGMRLLSDALMDREPRVRTLAAIKLDSVVSPAAVPGWLSLLTDADASLRERAAISLGVIGDPNAIDALTATMINDAEPVVRQQAARSLGLIASGGGD